MHDLLPPHIGALRRLQDRLHQRGDAAISEHSSSLPRRRVRKGRSRQRRVAAARDFVRIGVECEIAVRLARDLGPTEAPFTAEWVAEAIEAYYPAIEIVDDRYVEWETLGAPTLVADDFFAAGCVLGEGVPRSAAPDLLEVVGRALINGEVVGQGTGADVLGHPHNALAWLANHLAAGARACARARSC